MSENISQNSESAVEATQGMFDKVKSFAMSKKGLYLLGAVMLLGAIYYYTQCRNKKSVKPKKKSRKESRSVTEETDIPEPPPGYVTVPVEMLQGLQQDQMYQDVPNNMGHQMQQLPPQHQQEPQQQAPPELKHNPRLEEEEEEEIANQNLSKEDMASIQAQLNAMQREGSSA